MSEDAEKSFHGTGTTLAQWQASRALQSVPTISRDLLLPAGHRLVVVAPHPDDEVLMCGGLLANLAVDDNELLLISVTDGTGSHPDSTLWPVERLRRERPRESAEALSRLGFDPRTVEWRRLELADSAVADSHETLLQQLCAVLRSGDRVLTTWRHDGHCDHEAVGRACASASRRCQAQLLEVPVWAWHWAHPEDPRLPWLRARKLAVPAHTLERKRAALAAHRSQVLADPSTGRPAILSTATLERLLQPFELVFL